MTAKVKAANCISVVDKYRKNIKTDEKLTLEEDDVPSPPQKTGSLSNNNPSINADTSTAEHGIPAPTLNHPLAIDYNSSPALGLFTKIPT